MTARQTLAAARRRARRRPPLTVAEVALMKRYRVRREVAAAVAEVVTSRLDEGIELMRRATIPRRYHGFEPTAGTPWCRHCQYEMAHPLHLDANGAPMAPGQKFP